MSERETTALDVFMADLAFPEWARRDYEALAVRVETQETALREIGSCPEPLGPRTSPAAAQCDYLKGIARAALAGLSVGPADDKETT
jgi:hypothetical protein